MNSHTEVVVNEIPKCDFCEIPASYDIKTKMGCWANTCEKHFKEYGIGLGLGRGQKLEVKK